MRSNIVSEKMQPFYSEVAAAMGVEKLASEDFPLVFNASKRAVSDINSAMKSNKVLHCPFSNRVQIIAWTMCVNKYTNQSTAH